MHVLDALGNPVRREILRLLGERPCPVQEIARQFPVSRPAISRHLHVLEEAGLVRSQAMGPRNVYSLRPEGFEPARQYLDQLWGESLRNLEALARR